MKKLALILSLAFLQALLPANAQEIDLAARSEKATRADVAAIPIAVGSLDDFFNGFARARGIEWLKPEASGAVYACATGLVKSGAQEPGFFAARERALAEAIASAKQKLCEAGFEEVERQLCTVSCAERRDSAKSELFVIGVIVKLDKASRCVFAAECEKGKTGLAPQAWAQGGSFVSAQLMGSRFFYDEKGCPCVLAFGQAPIAGKGAARREAIARAVLRAGVQARDRIARFAKARGAKVLPGQMAVIEEGIGKHPGGLDFAYSVALWSREAQRNEKGGDRSAARPSLFDF